MKERTAKEIRELTCRSLELRKDTINKEERSVEAVLSTEKRVTVMDWKRWMPIDEILLAGGRQMTGEQVIMLDSHMRFGIETVLGSIRNIREENKNTIGRLFFAKDSDNSDKAWNLVEQAHLTDVSIGYRVIKYQDIEIGQSSEINGKKYDNKGDRILRVSTSWKLMEGSLVPIGANDESKIKRELLIEEEKSREIINNLEKKKMAEDEKRADEALEEANKVKAKADAERFEADTRTKELARIDEIYAIGKRFGIEEEAAEAVKKRMTVEAFRIVALEKLEAKKHIDTNEGSLGLSDKERKEYSFQRMIQATLTGNFSKAGFERECSQATAKLLNRAPTGFFVPQDILLIKRELTASGSSLVGTDHKAENFIELLRNKSKVIKLGAWVLSNLVGNVSIPKQTGAATAYWVAESGDVTPSDSSYGNVTLSPKTVGAATLYSRNMLLQSNPSIEALVLNDLINVIALAIDLGALHGTGASNQPTGIALTSGIGSVVGTSFDWSTAVKFETDVAAANADIASMAYLANAVVRGILKQREKATNTAQFLMAGGEMNGYPVEVSNQVSSGDMFFGVWSQLIIGLWSGLDILVDPFTNAADGGVYIRAFQTVDIAVRHAAAFSYSNNID